MRMYDCISKKKSGFALSKEEIKFLVDGYTSGEIPDYQMSAFLMAVCLKGMTKEETLSLTMAMAESGDILDLSAIHGCKADKHSTGGVGDKTTLVVAPMVAALKVPVAKMSGRGLGHTGGTIDKLESFPGFRTALTQEEFFSQVNRIGLAVMAQTANLAPADKKIYALRDVTATVDSMPLIASSIMSKKLAAGASVIVLDVKSGSGAFMKTLEDSVALAKQMVDIGNGAGRKTYAVVTDMNQPLGNNIGNILEVKEAVDALNGCGPDDLMDASCTLAAQLLVGAGKAASFDEGYQMAEGTIKDGSAFEKFCEFIEAQGGDAAYAREPQKFPTAPIEFPVKASASGYIFSMDTEQIGLASLVLGAGREKKEDKIDLAAGIRMCAKIGDFVEAGQKIAVLYTSEEKKAVAARDRLLPAITISKEQVVPAKHVLAILE